MYRKKSRGWYKHKDFILIDLICLFLSLIIAYLIRNGSVQSLFRLEIYRNMMIFVILADLFLIIMFESLLQKAKGESKLDKAKDYLKLLLTGTGF